MRWPRLCNYCNRLMPRPVERRHKCKCGAVYVAVN